MRFHRFCRDVIALFRFRQRDKYFIQAQRVRRLISEDFDKVFRSGVDVILCPTVIGDAIPFEKFRKFDNIARSQEQDVCTQPVNMAGSMTLDDVTVT